MTTEHEPLDLRCIPQYRELTVEQGRLEFERFMARLPERIRQLGLALAETGWGHVHLDYREETVAQLGAWLDTQVETMPREPEVVVAERARVPGFVQVQEWILTPRTLSICNDIGVYMGESLVRVYDVIEWDFVRRPRSAYDLMQPVVVGIQAGGRVGDPKRRWMNPIGAALGAAMGAVGGKPAAERLPSGFELGGGICWGLPTCSDTAPQADET